MTRALAIFLVGCGSAADIDMGDTGGTTTFEIPVVAGVYDVTWSEVTGCDGLSPPIAALTGEATIEQQADALTLTFAEVTLAGSVDASFTWMIADDVVVDGWSLDVAGDGLAYSRSALWVLEGDLSVQVADPEGTTCALTARFVARELDA